MRIGSAPEVAGGRPGGRDLALAAVVTLAALFAPVTGGSGITADMGWLGLVPVACAIGQGLPLIWRGSHPVACSAMVLGSYAGTALLVGVTPPLGPWVLIWSTGSRWGGTGRPPQLISGVIAAATCALIGLAELAQPGAGASALLIAATLLVALGAALVRTDRARVQAVRDQAAAQERLRIARDLHDVVGHGLSVVAIQSSTARLALDAGDPDTARSAIGVVEAASRTAMREMRQMLGVLKEVPGEPLGQGLPGIADISNLVADVRKGGIVAACEVSGDWHAASPATQLCAYRIVQEALTNAVKHAPGRPVSINVVAGQGELRITVSNPGAGTGPGSGPAPGTDVGAGVGLAGLRARVDAVAGEFQAGPSQEGWRVAATLPMGTGHPTQGPQGIGSMGRGPAGRASAGSDDVGHGEVG